MTTFAQLTEDQQELEGALQWWQWLDLDPDMDVQDLPEWLDDGDARHHAHQAIRDTANYHHGDIADSTGDDSACLSWAGHPAMDANRLRKRASDYVDHCDIECSVCFGYWARHKVGQVRADGHRRLMFVGSIALPEECEVIDSDGSPSGEYHYQGPAALELWAVILEDFPAND